MKNHFFFGYAGNKRQEVENIYNFISQDLNNNIETIIEPFCGTSAFSYYLFTLFPKRFKYILNDNNKLLIELYNIAKDDIKLDELIENLTVLQNKITNKEEYNDVAKKINKDILSWLFCHMRYYIRPGLYPLNGLNNINFDKLKNAPIINFLKNENVTILNDDGLELYKRYCNNNKCLIFLDPPYLNSCNDFYVNKNCNIYEYTYDNPIKNNKSVTVLCLENNFIIKMLFKEYKNTTYGKTYESTKKKTTHVIVKNQIA